MARSRSPSPTMNLQESLHTMSLSQIPNLADEDMTITSSSGFSPSRNTNNVSSSSSRDTSSASIVLPPPVRDPAMREKEFAYTGSMGVLPAVVPLASTSSSSSTPPNTHNPAQRTLEEDDGADDNEANMALRAERDSLREMNDVFEKVLGNLTLAEGKMESFEKTIQTSHRLLDLYVKLCSQAEHTQEALLNPLWGGSTNEFRMKEELARQKAEEEERIRLESEAAAEREREAIREAELAKERELASKAEKEKASSRGGASGRGSGLRGRGRGTTSSIRGGASSVPPTTSSIARGRGSATVTGVRGVRGIRSRGNLRGKTT